MCSWFLFLLRFILAPIAGTDQEMGKMGTGYAAKTGTGYAIPNFPELIAAASLPRHAQDSENACLAPPFGKLGIA
jgi:hypothetical protein